MKYVCDVAELEKEMIDKGIKTNLAFAKLSGINRNEIGKILNSNKLPSAKEMYAIVECLDLSAEKAGKIFFANNLRNT